MYGFGNSKHIATLLLEFNSPNIWALKKINHNLHSPLENPILSASRKEEELTLPTAHRGKACEYYGNIIIIRENAHKIQVWSLLSAKLKLFHAIKFVFHRA